jgi:Druantia protein DruA/DDE_Tnp_1-associated/Transposase DDE domain
MRKMRQQRGAPGPGAEVAFRGVLLGAEDWAWIQRMVDDKQCRTRLEVARQVCRRFGWRQPCGAYALDAARLLLARCERRGLIRLPPPRRSVSAPRAPRWPQDVALGPIAGVEPLSLEGPVLVRPIEAQERVGWRLHMQRYHYLGDCTLVGESIRYAAFVGEQLVALLSWASASLHNAPRDQYIGWDAATKARGLCGVVNNVRFLILPWARVAHLASRVLAANLRRLRADWQQRYGHPVWLAESFVDVSRFRGTCYRASNWVELGETQGFGRVRGGRYEAHGQPKRVFVYPLHREAQQRLCASPSAIVAAPMEERNVIDETKLPQGAESLFELFATVTDFRKRRGLRHRVQFILAATVCAVVTGCKSITAIAEWAADQSRETLLKLGSKCGRPPSERTLRRVFGHLDVAALDQRIGEWTARHAVFAGQGLALDGKAVRGSADGQTPPVHLVSAVLHREGLVVAQHRVPDKTNEIKSVEPVLAGLNIEGAVVTGDAMFTQKQIATHIVKDKKADYLLTVKDNQPTLRNDIESLRLEAFPPRA